MQDAVSALVNLGYRKGEAENNVRAVLEGGEDALENILKEASHAWAGKVILNFCPRGRFWIDGRFAPREG